MKVYIVQQNDELKIFTIKPEDEAYFLDQYGNCIIAKGSSIQDVILQFAKLKENESGG